MDEEKKLTEVPELDTETCAPEEVQPTNNEDKHSIYNYFKNHPSVLIATVSALVAVLTVVLNYINFVNINAYLSYFEIEYSSAATTSQFRYFLAISAGLLAVLLVSQGFISRTFEAYLPHKRRFLLYKYALHESGKRRKKTARLLKKVQKRTNNLPPSKQTNPEAQEIQKLLELCRKVEHKTSNEYDAIKQEIKKEKQRYHFFIGLSCFIAWIIMFIICLLMFTVVVSEIKHAIIPSGLTALIYTAITAIENWFLYCVIQVKRRQIKKDAQKDESEWELSYDEFPDIPLESMVNIDVKHTLKNTTFGKGILALGFALILLTAMSSWLGTQSAKSKNTFYIVTRESADYAVIYTGGDTAILEKATIRDNTIAIDTTEQMMISLSEVPMKKQFFNEVNIIPLKKILDKEETSSDAQNADVDTAINSTTSTQ